MKQFLIIITIIFSFQCLYSQIPCETECCPNGAQHTFDGQSGPLPPQGTLTNGGWEALTGSPVYNATDGCNAPGSISLFGTTFSPGDEAVLTESGVAGPIDIFVEGNTYCINMNVKNLDILNGQLELYAGNILIATTPAQNSSAGCQAVDITWTATTTSQQFSIKNNSTGPLDNPPTLLVDDICIDMVDPNQITCQSEFSFEEGECGEYCFFNESCGEFTLAVWTFFGPGLPLAGDPIASFETCYTFALSGTYTVDLTIFCSDGSSNSSTKQIIVSLPNQPSFNCPSDETINITGPDCEYEYTFPDLNVMFGNDQCQINGVTVNTGDIVNLPPGIHQVTCVISSECYEPEQCNYSIEIICEEQNTLCGQSVVTCFSGNSPDNSIGSGFVLGIVNNKEWGPNQTGLDWAGASGSNINHHPTWIASRLGEVFGLAIDGSNLIYTTSTSLFGNTLFGSAGSGGIYQVDPVTGTVTDYITTGNFTVNGSQIPNDGAGLGNICYDPDHNQLFVTNFFDGNIYRIDIATGTVVGSFDPFGATTVGGSPQFADLGQRPWGIAYNHTDQKLYYSNWLDYSGVTVNPGATTIHSVALDATGDFQASSESLEITLSQYWQASPISDIEFDEDGKMLVAQRSVQADRIRTGFIPHQWAHRSFVLEYQPSGTSWSLTPGHSGGTIPKFGVGSASFRNSAGGIDYGYESHPDNTTPQFCGQSVWSSGDNLTTNTTLQPWLYGLQGWTNNGGTNVNAVIIDYDGNYASGTKALLGDVQIFDCACYTSEVECDSLMAKAEPFVNPNNEDACCYTIDLKNNWGPDIVEIEVDILDPNWIFNTVLLDPAFSFGSCGALNQKMCISSPSGSIPAGITSDAFQTCFASLTNNPTTNPIIEIKWKQVVNEMDTVIVCRDTLTFNCAEPPLDTCLVVTNKVIECNPEDPTKYNYCFEVTNMSGVDVGQITIECLDPGFFFCPFNTNSLIIIPSPNPLPDGQTTQICIDIYASIPILTPQNLCMKLGLISADGKECCHNPVQTCVEIEPCCDPCELKDVIATNISQNEEECCYSIGLENLCEIPYFTKFEAEIITPGVCFGSHVINPTQVINWNTSSSSRNICMTPIGSGYIDQLSYPDLLDFCLDKIDDPIQSFPEIVFRWYAIDPLTGNQIVACTDTLVTECEAPDDNICLEIFDQDLECIQDSSKYRYTFTVVNKSNPAFTADRLLLTIKNDPSNFGIVPGPIIPITPPLASGDTMTFSTCIVPTTFPATISDLVFGYRLQNSQSGDCCFESACDTIMIPPCPAGDCCDDFEEFCDLVDLGFQIITNDDCSITIDATQFDTCHWFGTPAPDWGDGSIGLPVITPAMGAGPWTHTYSQPGTYNICITVFEGDDVDNFCWDKQMCTEVIVECPCPPDTSCFAVDNIIMKEFLCEVDSCYAEPFCLPWLTNIMNNSTSNGCQNIIDYSVFHRAIWNGQTVFVGYKDGAPDGGSQDIYDCEGNLIQSCTQGINVICNPDANIDISTDLSSFNAIWYCGDNIPSTPSDCDANTACADYCFDLTNTTNPNKNLDRIDITGITNVYPHYINLFPALMPGETRSISITVCGDVMLGDSIKLNLAASDICCTESVPICLEAPECPIDTSGCCTDSLAFCNLVDIGFQIVNNDDCTITVDASQFDSCHWYGTPGPDWGDGSSGFPVITPAHGAGPWTYTYDHSGTYNICITVFEGSEEDDFCWNKQMCTEVTIDCPCDPEDPCDDLSIYLDEADFGECCFVGGIENEHCADLYKGISIHVSAPASIAQVQAFNGWTLNQLNPQSAELLPPGGTIPIGDEDVFNICNQSVGSPIIISMSWLQADSNGDCVEVCSVTEEISCPTNQQGCVEIVQDSIDCENNLYCFKAVNITNPEIILKSLEFIWVSPSTASITPNPVSISPLVMGDTTDWVCVQYDATIGSTCFVLVGHEADLPAGEPVTWCCTDSTKYFITPEELCPCDTTDISCDALDITMVPDPISGDTCCFVGSIDNQFCADLFKGIKIKTITPASISSIQALNGWVINTISSSEAEVYPPTSHVPLGLLDVFSGCNLDGSQDPFVVNISWLIEDDNGDCLEYCNETFDLSCEGSEPDCVEIVADSLDCIKEQYCFKIKNNTSPAFTINSIDLVSILPSGTLLIPNPISIPPLASGSTSDWICVDYVGITFGDTLCYKTVAHNTDITAGEFPTWCCISSSEHCFILDEELCPINDECCYTEEQFCDLVDIGFQMTVDSSNTLIVSTTQFDSCHWFTTSTPDFDDGTTTIADTISAKGNISWTHQYANSGMYNICIEVIELSADSSICWQKEMCKMLWFQQSDAFLNPCDPSEINVPTGFTPNNDGFNDVFKIEGNLECAPIDLTIFNRWGQIVFEQKDYDNTWDGRSKNGSELSNGTYYIIIDFSNVDNQRSSNSRHSGYLDIRRN